MSGEKEWAKVPRETLENYPAGRRRDDPTLGRAKVELIKRDHDYAEQQEQSRRQFEQKLFEAQGKREVQRREFEQALAKQQMDHASTLAHEQLDTARAAATAAKRAAWAAGIAAVGSIAQAIIAYFK